MKENLKYSQSRLAIVLIYFIIFVSFFTISKNVSAENVQYSYDSLNRLIEVRYSDKVIRYTYDAAGNRTGVAVENLVVVPLISGLSPSSANAGTSGFTLVVSGSNFTNNSVVRWNGTDYTTVYVSANEVQTIIPASEINNAGTASVVVVNPSPVSASNSQTFSVNVAPTAAVGISGRIFSNNSAMSGVAVTLTGGAVTLHQTTDASGEYAFTGISMGDYTVTPVKTGYQFAPVRRTVLYLGENMPDNDFNALAVQPARRTTFDYDGDGKADFALFRPTNGNWYLRNSLTGEMVKKFGSANDKLIPADYDGDGITDFAFYRKRIWTYLQSSDGTLQTRLLGWKGDTPQPCDYDGDRKADLITFSDGIWRIRQSFDKSVAKIEFGANGNIPVAADYNGDGKCELAVFNPNNALWLVRQSNGESIATQFGMVGDKPVAGDFDGDGKSDFAVFRPSNGTWYISAESNYTEFQFGNTFDIPVPADYDGDGKTDLAVYLNGNWTILQSTNGLLKIRFGEPGDIPINILP